MFDKDGITTDAYDAPVDYINTLLDLQTHAHDLFNEIKNQGAYDTISFITGLTLNDLTLSSTVIGVSFGAETNVLGVKEVVSPEWTAQFAILLYNIAGFIGTNFGA